MRASVIGLLLGVACSACSTAPLANSSGVTQDSPLPQVALLVDGELRELPSSAATVGEFLRALKITAGPLDRIDPPPKAPITDGLVVRITRVSCRETVKEEPLPPRTIALADSDRPPGFTRILSRGKKGLARRVWRVWEKDGQETVRSLVREEVLRQPGQTVALRGARGLPTRGGEWRRPLLMEATAYEPGPRSCGKWATGYTATGLKAQKGVVAVDERVIPMGSRLYIPGYGFAVAADRGGAIKGMRIDLCFATYEEAIRFGRRRVKVYLLD